MLLFVCLFPMLQEVKAINNERLRRYELQRMRYYYAIVTCDTVETAMKIYQDCDGMEFERSVPIFPARFYVFVFVFHAFWRGFMRLGDLRMMKACYAQRPA